MPYVFRRPWRRQWRKRQSRVGASVATVAISGAGTPVSAGQFANTDNKALTGSGSLFSGGIFSETLALILANAGSPFANGAFADQIALILTGGGTLNAAGTLPAGQTAALTGIGSLFSASQFPFAYVNATGSGSIFAPGTLSVITGLSVPLTGSGTPYAAAGEVSTTVFLPSMTTGMPFAAGLLLPSFSLPAAGTHYSAGTLAFAVLPSFVGSGSPYSAAAPLLTRPIAGIGSLFAPGVFVTQATQAPAGSGSIFSAGALSLAEVFNGIIGDGTPFAVGALTVASNQPITLIGSGTPFSGGAFVPVLASGEFVGIGSPFSAGILGEVLAKVQASAGSLFAGGGFAPALVSGVIAGSGSLYAAGAIGILLPQTAGAGSLFAPGSFVVGAVHPFSGSGSLFSAGVLIRPASLSGTGSLYSANAFINTLAASIVGGGQLFAAGDFSVNAAGNLSLGLFGVSSVYGAGSFGYSILGGIVGSGSPFSGGLFIPAASVANIGIGSLFAPGVLTKATLGINIPGSGSEFSPGAFTFIVAPLAPSAGTPYSVGAFGYASVGILAGSGTPYSAGLLPTGGFVPVALSGDGSLFAAGTFISTSDLETIASAGFPFAAGVFSTSDLETIANAGVPFANGAFGPGGVLGLNGQGSSYGIYVFSLSDLIGSGSPFSGGLWSSSSDLEELDNAGTPFAADQLGTGVIALGVGSPYAAGGVLFRLIVADPRFGSAMPFRINVSSVGVNMPQGPNLSPMNVGETITGWIDFARWLPQGTTIEAVTAVEIDSLISGGPFANLIGSPAVGIAPRIIGGSGQLNTAVLQQWQAIAVGTIRVMMTILTSDGQTLQGYAHQQITMPS